MNEVRCPNCGRLLLKADGLGTKIEIKCPNCKLIVTWPSEKPEIANQGDKKRTIVRE